MAQMSGMGALGAADAPAPAAGAARGAAKALYVGNLSCFVTEDVLHDIFSTLGRVAECKVIKDKHTGLPAGYGFVRYEDNKSAELALASINGRVLYNQELRVNWAFQKEAAEDTAAHFHIFVGDLSPEINDYLLKQAFAEYADCSDARVLWDHLTGRSKSYGFVSFRTQAAAEDAIRRYNGEFIGNRRVRCDWAQHKQDPTANDFDRVDQADPLNANVYVGNLAPTATEQELQTVFSQYGEVVEVKLYRKGSYGFVQFAQHEDAVKAIVSLNGKVAAGKPLKCSWGRHQARQTPMNLSMLSMMAANPLLPPRQAPLLVQQLAGQQAAAQHLLLQQQLAGMSLGAAAAQPQGLQLLQSPSEQLLQPPPAQLQQPGLPLLQPDSSGVGALDPSFLYGSQPGGMLPPGGLPGLFYPP